MNEPHITPKNFPELDPEVFKKHAPDFARFCLLLKQIHVRLIMEGYVIEDGKVYKPEKKEEK